MTCIKYRDLKPGDVLFISSEDNAGENAALLIIATNELNIRETGFQLTITFMALFGCDWSGVWTHKYLNNSEAMEGYEVWRTGES